MAKFFDTISDRQAAFLTGQPVFFVATAASDGRINLSPKGYDTLRVIAPDRIAWLDLGGSGNETHAHLVADGRITLMTCNFAQPALIMRVYGRGRPVLPQDDGWDALASRFTLLPGTRQIFDVKVDQVQESCGYGVPFMTLERERDTLVKHHARTDPDAWLEKTQANTKSIDGLPTRATNRYISGEPGEG